jgi:hypothetical protein
MIRKRPKSYHSNTSFLDILFNTLVGFVLLFIIAFLLISPVKKKKEIEQKAEYVITVTWPGEMYDDIDSWLEDPTEKILYFQQKEVGLMHLDRDDLGSLNDTQFVPGVGIVNYPYNREITTIRGIVPGEYVFNVHLYRKVSKDISIPVTVIFEKLNPHVKLLYSKTVTLSKLWEEKTIIRFVLDVDGEIAESFFIYKPLVEKVIGATIKEETMTGIWEQQRSNSFGVEPEQPRSIPHTDKE